MNFSPTQSSPNLSDALSQAGMALKLEPTQLDRLTNPTGMNASFGHASQSLLFIDANVADYQTLVAGMAPGTEVHVLDSSQDAVTQITSTLLGRHNIASLHIVSHGEAGGLSFGSGELNLSDLPTFANQIQSWKTALTNDADILLYGCDVAQGEVGKAFVQILSQLTGADVAASDDLTGNASQGGDWILEYQTGSMEAGLAFSQVAMRAFHQTLAPSVIVNEFRRTATTSGTDEYVEFLLTTDQTANQLETLFFGDSISSTMSKFSIYQFTGLSSIATNFKAGTIIVVGGSNAVSTEDTTYNPVSTGDNDAWNIKLKAGGNNVAIRSGTLDFAMSDVAWIGNTNAGTESIHSISYRAGTGTAFGAFGLAASVRLDSSPTYLQYQGDGNQTSDTAQFVSDASGSLGSPTAGVNTTYINALRGASTSTSTSTVNLSTTTASLTEGNTGNFTVSRTGTSGDLIVNLAIDASSTAVFGSSSDYTLDVGGTPITVAGNNLSVTIPDTQTSVTLNLAALAEAIGFAEAADLLKLNLATGTGYSIGSSNSASIAIAANGFIVTNITDSGEGSLRQAILNANAIAGTDAITFTGSVFTDATPDKITLTSGQLFITGDTTITGSGANLLSISGNNVSTVVRSRANVILDGLTILEGNSNVGGGVYNGDGGNLTIKNSVITNNTSTNRGGGVYSGDTGTEILTIINSTISNNTNTGSVGGGGIWIQTGNTTNILNSTISGNVNNGGSSGGGGIYAQANAVNISGSTISGNSSTASGGGIQNNATMTITNTTITNNTADSDNNGSGSGGGVSGSNTTIRNSIVAGNFDTPGNSGPSSTTADVNGSFVDQGNNLIGKTNGSTGFTTSTLQGTIANPLDARLGALADNGGSTQTHALLPGSAAINAGTTTGAPTTDQRGISRVGAVDIGAFESRGFTIAVASGNSQSAPVNTAFTNPLAVTVSSAFNEPVAGGKITYSGNGSEFADASLAGNPATIDAAGNASATATANNLTGSYTVTAGGQGIATTASFSLTNTPPNAAPVVTVSSTPLSYTENDPTTLLDATATVSDDSTNFDTGTLTVNFSAGGTATDRLTIRPNANVTLDGRRVLVGGTQIGTYRGGSGTDSLVISLNASATAATTQALVRAIAYSSVSDALPLAATNRTVTLTLTDGDGGTSAAANQTISVTGSNDAAIVGGTQVLYDGSLNTPPQAQGWLFPPLGGSVAAAGGTTNFSTTGNDAIQNGFTRNVTSGLNATTGYTLSFTAQVVSSTPNGSADKDGDSKVDRAGFNLIVVSSDATKAIELSFLNNEIFAQADGTDQLTPSQQAVAGTPSTYTNTLFTRGETATFATTSLTNYDLTVSGNLYTLYANGTAILSGRMRDYTAFTGTPDPYEVPNQIFIGDDTTSASANINLSRVAVTTNSIATQTINEDGSGSVAIGLFDLDGTPPTVSSITSGNTTLIPDANFAIAGSGNSRQLNFTPAANQFGTASVTLNYNDGTANSRAFNLVVNSVNDQPIVTPGSNQTITAGAAAQTVASWATFNPGATNETTQTATYTITNNTNPGIFATLPAIAPNGTLTYTPVSSIANSTIATITVQVQDNGGTINNGIDTSATQTFTITVNPAVVANGAPSISAIANQSVLSNSPSATIPFTISDPETVASNLTVSATSSNLALIANANITLGGSGSDRTIQLTPTANQTGNATISVTVNDGTNSTTRTFDVTVSSTSNSTGNGFDFNNDGKNDILWRNPTTKENQIWLVNGNTYTKVALDRVNDPGWSIAGTGDFDSDGQTDIFWHHENGANVIWKMAYTPGAASATRTIVNLRTIDPRWKVAGIGDFDGDRQADIFWHIDGTGENVAWKLNPFVTTSQGTSASETNIGISTVGNGWRVSGLSDINGDGITDILWRHSTTGENALWQNAWNGTASTRTVRLFPTVANLNWSVAGLGDIDGNGTVDLVWRNQVIGENALWKMDWSSTTPTRTIVSLQPVTNLDWQMRGIGDFNGDGKADILWRKVEAAQDASVLTWAVNPTTGSGATQVNTFLPGGQTPDWSFASSRGIWASIGAALT